MTHIQNTPVRWSIQSGSLCSQEDMDGSIQHRRKICSNLDDTVYMSLRVEIPRIHVHNVLYAY